MLKVAVNQESKRKSDSRKNKGKTISPKTVANEYGLITAVINEYTDINTEVKLPAKINKIKELIPPQTVAEIFRGTNVELPVLLSMWLSFSLSEIKGLTKDSINDGYITIKQVCVTVDGKEIFKPQAKQFTRNRKMKIPTYIQSLIDEVETDILVPMSGKMIYYYFNKALKENGLGPMPFHSLRHMNASVMAKLNVPTVYAQERGGWKTDKVMKKVYTHTFSQEREAVDNTIDEYFNQIVNTNGDVDMEKYKAWLLLFNKKDCADSLKEFKNFKSITRNITRN